MGKSVAVIGDVTPSAGSAPYAPADSGSWSPTTVNYSSYPSLQAGERAVIHEAECIFVFTGVVSATGVPVSGEDTVTLTADTTSLQSGHHNVLVDSDCKESGYGNKLEVSATNAIETT